MPAAIELRPVREEDLSTLERLTQDPENTGEFAWFGWFHPRNYRREWTEDGLLHDGGGHLMVVRDAEPLGFVMWSRRPAGITAFCWEIGIALLPTARGQGHGTAAQRLLARYLFDHTPVHRIQAGTELDNIAEQRALEGAGFSREGICRGAGWRAGAWRDGVIYSLLRSDGTLSS
jgi:RimJ/RimL family protein N-acetyltransferase